MIDESATLFVAVGVAAVCHVKTVPLGLLVAVIVPKFTLVAGHVLVAVVAVNVGAVEPATQGADVTVKV